MMSRSFLALVAASLIGMAGAPAGAQAPHGPSQSKPQPAKPQPSKPHAAQPAKGRTTGAAHQKACRNRYKSYDARSDSYLYRGKRVRCAL